MSARPEPELPRLWTPAPKPFRFCPECGTELELGKPERAGYDPFTGIPWFTSPLVCPISSRRQWRWRKRCSW